MSDETKEEKAPEKTPEEVVAELARAIDRYPARTLADLQLEFLAGPPESALTPKDYWPGKMSYYGERGVFTGARAVRVSGDAAFNEFFETHLDALCIDYKLLESGEIMFLYTSRLSEEDQQEFNEFQEHVEGHMKEYRKKRAEEKQAKEFEKHQALNRLLELATAGQKYLTEVKPNLKKAKKGK